MRKSRFSPRQIAVAVNQLSEGVPIPTLCCEHGISSSTAYNWRRNASKNQRLLEETRQEAIAGIDALCLKHNTSRCKAKRDELTPEEQLLFR